MTKLARVLALLAVIAIASTARAQICKLSMPAGCDLADGDTWYCYDGGASSDRCDAKTPVKPIILSFDGDGVQCGSVTKTAINSNRTPVHVITCADNDASVMSGPTIINDGYAGGTFKIRMEALSVNADPNACGTAPCEVQLTCGCQCRGIDSTHDNTYSASPVTMTFAFTHQYRMEIVTSSALTCNGTCTGGSMHINTYCEIDATPSDAVVADVRWFANPLLIYSTKVSDE